MSRDGRRESHRKVTEKHRTNLDRRPQRRCKVLHIQTSTQSPNPHQGSRRHSDLPPNLFGRKTWSSVFLWATTVSEFGKGDGYECFGGNLLQESDGAGLRGGRRTKFPVSSARRCYFQIEAGLVFFVFFPPLFFYATHRNSISPARLVAPPLFDDATKIDFGKRKGVRRAEQITGAVWWHSSALCCPRVFDTTQ